MRPKEFSLEVNRFISQYLKAADVTSPQAVTIAGAEVVAFKDQESGETRESLALSFEELEQRVVTSKTSLQQLVALLGSNETDEWIGKRVTLFNDKSVMYRGRPIGGLRFKEAK